MVVCKNCRERVKPNIDYRWSDFIRGLGIFYLIYIFTKIPQCPNCNFPMPRRTIIFAVHFPRYFVKLAEMSVSQLTSLKDSVESASQRSYLKHKFDQSQYISGMKIYKTPSQNMMGNKIRESISLRTMTSKSNIRSCDLYDKETIRIFDNLGSQDERS
jgi:hypothetical protein